MLNSFRSRLILFLCISGLTLIPKAFSETVLSPKLGYSSGSFQITDWSPAISITPKDSEISFHVISQDKNLCGLNTVSENQLKLRLNAFVKLDMPQLLNRLSDSWQTKLTESNVHVVFGHFETIRTYHRIYSKIINIQDKTFSFIWVDCRELDEKRGLESALAHELTHVLLSGKSHQPWFIEALAQMQEEAAGGLTPALKSLKALETSTELPILQMTQPLRTHAEYGLVFLWAKSITAQFKSFLPLKYMIEPGPRNCEENSDYFDRLVCRSNAKMESSADLQPLAPRMNVQDITRDFKQVLEWPSGRSVLRDPWLWRGRSK